MLSRAAQASSFGPSTDSAVGEFDSKVVVITGSGRGVGRGHRGGPCARGRADRSRRFLCAANSKAIAEDNGPRVLEPVTVAADVQLMFTSGPSRALANWARRSMGTWRTGASYFRKRRARGALWSPGWPCDA